MDEAFLLRARRLLDERRATLDFSTFVQKISLQAAETPTGRATAAVNQRDAEGDEIARLSSLILGDADWRSAARHQNGCFNRAIAKRPVNLV